MTWVILATGPSTSAAQMLHVKHLPCIAVNNAYRDAPWARALVGNDAAWWREYPDAYAFAGDKWCSSKYLPVVHWMAPTEWTGTHSNSALRALDLAIRHYRASRVLLLGVDLIGRHYHADHPTPLKNPDAARFALFRQQFASYASQLPTDVEVLNCSPISTLDCFPKCSLDQALEVATC